VSTSLLDHAFGIRGYQSTRTDYQDGQVIFTIHQEPETCRCSACGARDVQSRGHVVRRFRSLPLGSRVTVVLGRKPTPSGVGGSPCLRVEKEQHPVHADLSL